MSSEKILLSFLCFLTSLLIWSGSGLTAASPKVIFHQEKLEIQAREIPLGQLLGEISEKCDVEILGLENRDSETITFSTEGESVEDGLKRLLRFLGEDNCAFEFTDVRLVRVSVFPKSKAGEFPSRQRPSPRAEKKEQKKFGSVVKVQGIKKGTQAEDLNLRKGDLIIEYDGIPITSSRQLVREVRKNKERDSIDMTVVRDKEPVQFTVRGGLIGVRVHTAKILQEELEQFQR